MPSACPRDAYVSAVGSPRSNGSASNPGAAARSGRSARRTDAFSQTLQRFWRAVRRKPTGVCSLRALHLLCDVFTEGDLGNPSSQRAGMRKTGGLTPTARRSVCRLGKPAGLRQPLATRYATTGFTQRNAESTRRPRSRLKRESCPPFRAQVASSYRCGSWSWVSAKVS